MKKTATCLWLAIYALALLQPAIALAQDDSRRVVKAEGRISVTAVRPGDKFKIAVALDIANGYHVNADIPTDENGIGTKAELTPPPGIVVAEPKYPLPQNKAFSWNQDKPIAVLEGKVHIIADAEATSSLQLGEVKVPARITVQACDDRLCLAPAYFGIEIPIRVVAPGTPVSPANADFFTQTRQAEGEKDDLGALIASSGLPLALLTVFLAGLALNLTPCVYPIIPITIGFFVNQAAAAGGKQRLSRTFMMASTYVFGMAITYSLLGVVASLTGGLFGAALQNPIVLIGIAGVMLVLALSMFGFYEFRVPDFMNRFASSSTQSSNGLVGALMMGLTMGIVAAPCIGPFVIGLLVHVSAVGQPVYGFVVFFILALGLGLPYVFLGAFSGSIKNLPRSGEWMVTVRKVFGLILVGMALYFLMPLMGQYVDAVFIAFFSAAAAYLLFIEARRTRAPAFAWILRGIGTAAAVAAVWMAVPQIEKPQIPWQPYSDAALAEAQQQGRPVVIDVFADWCLPCKELDRFTFTDTEVRREAERFVTLKLDLTANDAESEAGRAREKFDILGVPTVLFLDATGTEHPSLRLTQFEKAEPFLDRLKKVPAGSVRLNKE